MSKIKVILQGSCGSFEPTEQFDRLIKQQGYEHIFHIGARTDKVLIDYVEQHAHEDGILLGEEKYLYVYVAEVDTSRPWTIRDYDGSESIDYLDYEFIDKNLNYVRLK